MREYRVTSVRIDSTQLPGLRGVLRVWRDRGGLLDWEMTLVASGIVEPPSDTGSIEAALSDGRTFSGGFVAPSITISSTHGTRAVLKGNGPFGGLVEWE